MTVTLGDYAGMTTAWCPGCGNFGILKAFNQALVDLLIEPSRLLMVSGIGQAGKLPHYTKGNVLNVLHGRPLPSAIGAKIVNPELIVIAISGDGDAYGEGGNHFLHSVRRNHDITYLVHDNRVYGLTKGQASPTSDAGFVTKTSLDGAWNPLNPLTVALAAGASFVARGFSGDIVHLSSIIKMGINHKGFALIDILQPCVSFNHKNTFTWYKERVYKLEGDQSIDTGNKNIALAKAEEWGDRIPIGVFYQKQMPTFEDQLHVSPGNPLVKQAIKPEKVAALLDSLL
jgi:2-oxoglutarate/2-oxoacid ferredoxin oxidoreductase subunit beta